MILPSFRASTVPYYSEPSAIATTLPQGGEDEDDGELKADVKTSGVLLKEGKEERFKVRHRSIIVLPGLLAPFAILLDIPGLTERWYVRTEGFQVVETRQNPIGITVIMSFSITLGVLANSALICRFMEKHVRFATWFAIFCLTLHDILNCITIILFGVMHRFISDEFTYGNAYYMTVASTTASVICNITLLVDLYRTPEFSKHGSGLTEKQRSLVAAVMILICYIGFGSLAFSLLLDLTYINSLYFTICTMTSTGFGDIVPTNLASKIFSFPFDVGGLILLAFTITIARSTVIEKFEDSYRYRRGVLAARAEKRKLELAKRVLLRKEMRERGESEEDKLSIFTLPLTSPAEQREMDYEDELASGISFFHARFNSYARFLNLKKPLEHPIKRKVKAHKISIRHHHLLQEQEYVSFKKQMAREQEREFRLKLGIALSLFFIFWLGWTFFISLYFCFIFFTTIGYGDYHPNTQFGRAFFVAWSILGIATMTLLLSVLTETWSSKYKSSINDARAIRTIRQATKASTPPTSKPSKPSHSGSRSQTAANQLLAVDGYSTELLEMKSFGEKIILAMKGFSEHARYFMHGRTGDTPIRLRNLIDASNEFDDEMVKLKDGGYGEVGSHVGTRHFLFMISYERSFDSLLELGQRLSSLFTSHSEELEKMKLLNSQLRSIIKLHGAVPIDEEDLVDEVKEEVNTIKKRRLTVGLPIPFPFVMKPPGGRGDEVEEDTLIAQIDSDIEDNTEILPTEHTSNAEDLDQSSNSNSKSTESTSQLESSTTLQIISDTMKLLHEVELASFPPGTSEPYLEK